MDVEGGKIQEQHKIPFTPWTAARVRIGCVTSMGTVKCNTTTPKAWSHGRRKGCGRKAKMYCRKRKATGLRLRIAYLKFMFVMYM